MMNNKNKVHLKTTAIVVAVFGLLLSTFTSISHAQTTLPPSPAAIASTTTRTFVDDTGFAIDIPPGWVVQDYNNTSAQDREVQERLGWTILAIICGQDEALPAIGGGVNCEQKPSSISVTRHRGFAAEPVFSGVQNITVDDFFAYDLQEQQRESNFENFQIVSQNNSVPITISSLDVNTGQQTNKTINGKLVTVTFSRYGISGGVSDMLYFIVEDGTTAYKILADRPRSPTPDIIPQDIKQMLTSARLVIPPSSLPQ